MEKNKKKKPHMYNWITLLYRRNEHNIIINYTSIKLEKKVEIDNWNLLQ